MKMEITWTIIVLGALLHSTQSDPIDLNSQSNPTTPPSQYNPTSPPSQSNPTNPPPSSNPTDPPPQSNPTTPPPPSNPTDPPPETNPMNPPPESQSTPTDPPLETQSKPTDPPPQSKPTDPPPQSKPTDSPPQSKPTDSPPQSKPTDSPPQSKPTDPPPQSKPTDPPPQSSPTAPSPQSNPEDTPPQSNTSDPPSQSNPTDPPHQSKPTDPPTQFNPTDMPSQSNTVDLPPQSSPTDTPPQSNPTDTPPQSNPKGTHPQSNPTDPPPQSNLTDPPQQTDPNDLEKQTHTVTHSNAESVDPAAPDSVSTVSPSQQTLEAQPSTIQMISAPHQTNDDISTVKTEDKTKETFTRDFDLSENSKEDVLFETCKTLGKKMNGKCSVTVEIQDNQLRATIKIDADQYIQKEQYKDSQKTEQEDAIKEIIPDTLIAILASCGALVLILCCFAAYCTYHRRSYRKNQQHLTEELQTVENGYHDNPTLEVMEVQPEMQEKKVTLNRHLNDSWIVPIDNLLKEDMADEEDTHL